jgi:zinc carboxypeptidase/N-acetylmuramoyl-L-alanine amidase-like protein
VSFGRRRRETLAIAAACALLASARLTILRQADAAPGHPAQVVIGHSVQGRAIEAVRVGDPDSPRKALVVGVIHGDEPAGGAVTRQILRRFRGSGGVDLWVIKTVNPDGLAAHARRNAHGVDLNRNFSYRWRAGSPSSGYYPGPRPFSEPESRSVRKLVRKLQPQVSIWFHQPWDQVLAPCHGDASLQRHFSELSGIPLKRCRSQHLHGTAISWQNHGFPGSKAFVVELPGGAISARAARRDARAVVRVARDGVAAGRRTRATASSVPRPPTKPKLIPFPPHRKREMAAYSKRHYGKRQWRLIDPKVIVEHISVTSSVDAVYNTFAPDIPDPELHELPNVCSHFVVGSNGRAYQLVHLNTRCRHTVGLNYTAIGVEHVGFADADVLGNRRQLRASLRLTRYLRCRFGIEIRNVIGHNESLSSPYHFELVPSLKNQTHSDWKHASMQVYRRKLRHLGPC